MRRALLIAGLWAAAQIAAPQVTGQIPSTADQERGVSEVVVDGVQFRVPFEYFKPPTPEALKTSKGLQRFYRYEKDVLHAEELSFSFWISDLKSPRIPVGTPQQKLVGPGVFWPPEPGRPYFVAHDFVVRVVDLVPTKPGFAPLNNKIGPNRIVEHYGRLACGTDRENPTPIVCQTPVDDEIVVSVGGQFYTSIQAGYAALRMYVYSRPDSLRIRIDLPLQALLRWEAVVCNTLSLIRTWRVSGGPPPDGCSKLPARP